MVEPFLYFLCNNNWDTRMANIKLTAFNKVLEITRKTKQIR